MILAEPLHSYVRVRLLPVKPQSSLIEVVGAHDPNIRRAVIEAVGPDCLDAAVGQTVLCSVRAGVVIGNDGSLLLPETAIMALVIE